MPGGLITRQRRAGARTQEKEPRTRVMFGQFGSVRKRITQDRAGVTFSTHKGRLTTTSWSAADEKDTRIQSDDRNGVNGPNHGEGAEADITDRVFTLGVCSQAAHEKEDALCEKLEE